MAELQTLSFPEGTVPDGYAIPFYFYDEFMKHNNFYTRIQTMLDDEEFQTDFDTQEAELKKVSKNCAKTLRTRRRPSGSSKRLRR